MRRFGTILSLQLFLHVPNLGHSSSFGCAFCGDGESPKIGMHRCMCEHESSNSMTFYAAAPLSRVPRTLSSCNISLAGINISHSRSKASSLAALVVVVVSLRPPARRTRIQCTARSETHRERTKSAHREHPEYRVSISRGAPTRNRQPSTSPRPSLLHRPRTARPSTSRRRFEQREREHARLIVHAHAHAAARGAATGLLRQRYLGRRA